MATDEKKGRNDSTRSRGLLIILTLKKHVEGIWITKLVEKLKQSVPTCSSFQTIEIEIRILEDWLAEGWLISADVKADGGQKIIGIVNRVSDAASPAVFKACCALLAAAEQSLQIPVWNGSNAYSLCGNKWRHHLLFRQAKLSAPTTMVYYTRHVGDSGSDNDSGEPKQAREKTINVDMKMFRQSANGTIEVLVKPNAGGFGAGIRKISLPITSSSDVTNARRTAQISIPLSFEDDMALVQQYEIPSDGNIYRVWFLNGKVQCAVKRNVKGEVEDNTKVVSSPNEFTSGCASGNLCKLPVSKSSNKSTTDAVDDALSLSQTSGPSNFIPWEVPEEVRQEIEDRLLPLLTDAHCGSVEFLYAHDNLQRLYFDLNLLSTLPITDNEVAGESVWPKDFDPWLELAHGIWEFFIKNESSIEKER